MEIIQMQKLFRVKWNVQTLRIAVERDGNEQINIDLLVETSNKKYLDLNIFCDDMMNILRQIGTATKFEGILSIIRTELIELQKAIEYIKPV